MVRIHPRASIPQERSKRVVSATHFSATSFYIESLKGNGRKSSPEQKQSHPPRSCVPLFPDTGPAPLAGMERNSFSASSGNILDRIPGDYDPDAGNGVQVTDI